MKKREPWIWPGLAIYFVILWMAGCGRSSSSGTPKGRTQEAGTSSSFGGTRYDLSKDEERGHTLKKHVGRSDEELVERLQRERDIFAASTWTDRETAEETVGKALQVERGRIESWESRGYPRSNLALHFNARRVIGRSIRQGEAQSTPCSEAVIVLKADGAESFFILTTYPEARE